MNKRTLYLIIESIILIGLTLGFITVVQAETQAYSLPWSVMSSGVHGGISGSYTITSTLGQPVAGLEVVGDHPMTSGFWGWVGEALETLFIYLPQIRK